MLWNILCKKDGNVLCQLLKKNNTNKNSSFRITRQNRLMLISNCTICGKNKLRLIKNQELH